MYWRHSTLRKSQSRFDSYTGYSRNNFRTLAEFHSSKAGAKDKSVISKQAGICLVGVGALCARIFCPVGVTDSIPVS